MEIWYCHLPVSGLATESFELVQVVCYPESALYDPYVL